MRLVLTGGSCPEICRVNPGCCEDGEGDHIEFVIRERGTGFLLHPKFSNLVMLPKIPCSQQLHTKIVFLGLESDSNILLQGHGCC